MTKKYDVYVAGPFFNPSHIEEIEFLEKELAAKGLTMFRPRLDSVNLAEDSSSWARQKAFEDDVRAIEESRFVLANTRDKDMGTIFEVGYAYKAGVPVVGYAGGLPPGAPFNIMLAGSMVEVFTTREAFSDFIDRFWTKQDMLDYVSSSVAGTFDGAVQ